MSDTANCRTCNTLVWVTDIPCKTTGNCWHCEVERLGKTIDRRENDYKRAMIEAEKHWKQLESRIDNLGLCLDECVSVFEEVLDKFEPPSEDDSRLALLVRGRSLVETGREILDENYFLDPALEPYPLHGRRKRRKSQRENRETGREGNRK